MGDQQGHDNHAVCGLVQRFALGQLQFQFATPTVVFAHRLATFLVNSFALIALNGVSAAEPTAAAQNRIIELDFHTPGTLFVPVPEAEPIYAATDLTVWRTATGFFLRCGASWVALDLAAKQAQGVLDEGFWLTRSQDQRDFFLLTLLMFAHRHGYYGLHANGLSDGHRDYLVIGPSGSGKSTLTVRLLDEGWAYSGDDVVLLSSVDDHEDHARTTLPVIVQALRREFALSTKTLRHSTPVGWDGQITPHGEKQIVAAACWAGAQFLPQLQPTRLLFATLIDSAHSHVAPLGQTDALVALAQQSAGIFTKRMVAQAQLHLLGALTTQAPAYRLALGRDVLVHPGRVAAQLQSI